MHGGAVSLAEQYKKIEFMPDLIICTDMLDMGNFVGLLRKEIANIPIIMYFHENQLSYPWNIEDADLKLKRDRHYGFINYTSALIADQLLFNSEYHKNSFLEALPLFLKPYPDHRNLESIKSIIKKSNVLYLGIRLEHMKNAYADDLSKNDIPIILWNHRWEYDKNPELFFNTLFKLKKEGIKFKLAVVGKKYKQYPEIFDSAKLILKNEIVQWGYMDSSDDYHNLLKTADFLPVTSNQDFFGISVVEAMSFGVAPLLPNRLAYPEHVEDSELLYENQQEFYDKLKQFLLGYANMKRPLFPNLLKYDWEKIIQEYDQCFNNTVINHSS
jgi:glycosyltransferase involved in cell wall biosynthesis